MWWRANGGGGVRALSVLFLAVLCHTQSILGFTLTTHIHTARKLPLLRTTPHTHTRIFTRTHLRIDMLVVKESIVSGAAAALLMLAPLGAPQAALGAASPPNVIDEAKSIPSGQERRLEERLGVFASESDYKIHVLTRDARRKEARMSSDEIKKLWNLPDENAVIIILDASKGNVLRFNSGEKVAKLLPDRFFNELTGRLGNRYAVMDEGENGVVEEAVEKIDVCLRRGGCTFVPGIGKDQYTATLVASAAGGVVFGFSLLTTLQFIEKKARGGDAIFKYSVMLYFPLWGLFYIGLGLNPLFQRQAEFQYFAQNTGAFLATAVVTCVIWPIMMKFDPPSINL